MIKKIIKDLNNNENNKKLIIKGNDNGKEK